MFYPGLETHPQHEMAKKQMRGFGAMVSFDVGSGKKAEELLKRVKYFTLAESLGAVESLISVPAKMTHASIPAERREQLGIKEGLFHFCWLREYRRLNRRYEASIGKLIIFFKK